MDFYDGPFKIVPGVDALAQRRSPGRGDIIRHASGAVVLRCPKCNAIQFARADVVNSDDAPTLDRPIQCGSGHCKKCGIWFSIRNGRASEVDEPERPKRAIPAKLAKAGVKEPPRLKLKEE